MLDYKKLRIKDLGQEGLSPVSVRDNARAKAVRASYEFWSTGNEALLEQAFAETFAEHAVRPAVSRQEWIAAKHAPRGRLKRNVNDRRRRSAPGPAQS